MTAFLALLVFAMSLCADCLAVTACSSVTLKSLNFKTVAFVALVFGIVQAGLLFIGWAFGGVFVGYVEKFAHWIGFLLLLYVGGSMIIEGVRNENKVRDLDGLGNVIIGALATSMDALAVGVSLSMESDSINEIMAKTIAVFAVTMISVFLGMYGGQKAGSKIGRPAEIIGGAVLVLIGLNILLGVV